MPQARDGGTVEIVVQLAPPADPAGAADVRRAAAADARVELRAMHPGSTDPELAAWAQVTVPAAEAEEAVARLSAAPGVAAAYVKPPGSTP
jgi:hypothetical protein